MQKLLNPDSLQGRSIYGIYYETILHYDFRFILKERTKVADIGDIHNDKMQTRIFEFFASIENAFRFMQEGPLKYVYI